MANWLTARPGDGCRYDDLRTVEAGLESAWADYASTHGYGTLLDEEFDVSYDAAGEEHVLEVAADHTRLVFTGPQYAVGEETDPVTGAYYTDHLPALESVAPALSVFLPDMTHDRFLEQQFMEICHEDG